MIVKHFYHNEWQLRGDWENTDHVFGVAQYADIGPEPAPNRFGTALGRHPILGGGIGGLRQLGADLRYDPSGLALA